jgi:hypothetical protein
MTYLISKKIKGHNYYYLCKSIREGKKVRQVIVKYYGRKKPKNPCEEKVSTTTGGDCFDEIMVEIESLSRMEEEAMQYEREEMACLEG